MEKIVLLFVLAICGANAIYNFNSDTRMIAGNLAGEGQFPYAISLQQISQLSTFTRGHRCGGVLITFQHALTTAACVLNYVGGNAVVLNAAEYRVFAGAVTLTNDGTADRVRSIANFTVHPAYTGPDASVNDIAIITFTTPFPNNTVAPIRMPSETFQPTDFTICNVAGWGAQNATASASVNMMFAQKYIYNQPLCTILYNAQVGIPNIMPTMICAASYDVLSVGCIGDHGNALVCDGELTGIMSLNNGCFATSYPEVYVRLSNYTTWVRSITGGASTFQPGVAVLFMFAVVQIITAKIIS